jgi:hydrogenase nickel incorporation protein HypA/HybF
VHFLLNALKMHEYSVASEIAAIVAQNAKGLPVKKISIAIGALSGIFSESLVMYLELLLPEMGMGEAKIETREVRATFVCSCSTEYVAESMTTVCPQCGGYERSIKSGHDCTIESIEVEDDRQD